jgi:hypothetical protein
MEFCKDCGTVLNIFSNNQREFCSSCSQHKKKVEPPPSPAPVIVTMPGEEQCELFGDALLSCENNKIVLRSKEGWELWSSPSDTQSELKTILARARQIYQIRLRRQKN